MRMSTRWFPERRPQCGRPVTRALPSSIPVWVLFWRCNGFRGACRTRPRCRRSGTSRFVATSRAAPSPFRSLPWGPHLGGFCRARPQWSPRVLGCDGQRPVNRPRDLRCKLNAINQLLDRRWRRRAAVTSCGRHLLAAAAPLLLRSQRASDGGVPAPGRQLLSVAPALIGAGSGGVWPNLQIAA